MNENESLSERIKMEGGIEATDTFMEVYKRVVKIYSSVIENDEGRTHPLLSNLDELSKLRAYYLRQYPILTPSERIAARELLGDISTLIGEIAARNQIRTVKSFHDDYGRLK